MSAKQKIIIDSDPGSDDLIAILYLLNRPDADILMINIVDGNVSIDLVSKNAQKIRKIADKRVSLYRGCHNPIFKKFPNVDGYHGTDGLGNIQELSEFDASDVQFEHGSGVLKMIELILEHPYEITVICLAPLTNLAIAYMLCPEIATLVKKIYVMGGSLTSKGNQTGSAEFNFVYDFIATKIVISNFSGLCIMPWEPTVVTYVREYDLLRHKEEILSKGQEIRTLIYHFITLIIQRYNGMQICDFYSVIPCFNSSCIKKYSVCKVDIVIDSEQMKGMILISRRVPISVDLREFQKNPYPLLQERGYHLVFEELDQPNVINEIQNIFLKT